MSGRVAQLVGQFETKTHNLPVATPPSEVQTGAINTVEELRGRLPDGVCPCERVYQLHQAMVQTIIDRDLKGHTCFTFRQNESDLAHTAWHLLNRVQQEMLELKMV